MLIVLIIVGINNFIYCILNCWKIKKWDCFNLENNRINYINYNYIINYDVLIILCYILYNVKQIESCNIYVKVYTVDYL